MTDPSKITVAILSAGLGTRLRPLTETTPKVMMPFDGIPLLEHTITLLRDQGFRKFVINLHSLPEKITTHLGGGERLGVEINYSDETKKLLETAGAIKKMEPLLSDPFLLIYGDQLHFYDFQPLLQFHEDHQAFGTLVLKDSDIPENGDVAEIDPNTHRITAWLTRPHGITELGDKYHINGGFSMWSKKLLDFIPSDFPAKLDGEILPPLMKTRRDLYGLPTKENMIDIGTLEKYEAAQKWYRQKKVDYKKESHMW
ncbi:MAG: NDP-sugar synthase [Patescibacteria group bacterium]